MRGCFSGLAKFCGVRPVLPAYAGMFPTSARKAPRAFCSPRVCGDVSEVKQHADLRSAFSPRMRGCFRQGLSEAKASTVLPAYAGMFRCFSCSLWPMHSSPRVCGDVSIAHPFLQLLNGFSPRMRGCFREYFFAGVLMLSSPRVCGDVSYPDGFDPSCLEFSPRMRGCFYYASLTEEQKAVLPAYAGMFPRILRM